MIDATLVSHQPRSRQVRLPRYLRIPYLFSVLLSCFMTFSILAVYFHLQPLIPIFYSLADPTDFVVKKPWIFLFPIIAFAITFSHLALLPTILKHEKIVHQMFAWATVLVQAMFLIGALRIIFIIY